MLNSIRSIDTAHPPAGVRPDPDLFVRQLIYRFRSPGSVAAQEIGRIDQYRLLMGGASLDFVKNPQISYDSTSLLAILKVAEEICTSLISPDRNRHPGWSTILPFPLENRSENFAYLVEKIVGIPVEHITADLTASLSNLLDQGASDGVVSNENYIPVCMSLVIDSQALLL